MLNFRTDESPIEHGQYEHRPPTSSLFWFEDVCRTIVNTHSLRFVAANAPAPVVTSFGAQQQRIARLSLQSANTMLLHRLFSGDVFLGSLTRVVYASLSKVRDLFLLALCVTGRVTLGLIRTLSLGIPRQIEIWISANLIAQIGGLILDSREEHELPLPTATAATHRDDPLLVSTLEEDAVKRDILRALRSSLPNDIASLIFLSTLRDNNSGRYFHPEVVRRYSDDIANQAMLACHREIYERIVALPLEDLTDQLDAYMKTVPVPRQRMIESWTKLRAYRATIPMDADPISTEIYFTKIDVSMAILASRIVNKAQDRSG